MELHIFDTGFRDFWTFTEELNFYRGIQKAAWNEYPVEAIVRDDKTHNVGGMLTAIWFMGAARIPKDQEFNELSIIGNALCERFTALDFEITEN